MEQNSLKHNKISEFMSKVRILAHIISHWFVSGTVCNGQEVQHLFSYHFSEHF